MRALGQRLAARLLATLPGHREGLAPEVSWPASPRTRRRDCPNCGAAGAKPVLLHVRYAPPGGPARRLALLRCPACTCPFYQDQVLPDYAGAAMFARGRTAFYLQQGAGLSLITRPLAQRRRPPGSRYLEVGCGFGFGLDFAVRSCGFEGLGVDPGLVAGLGRGACSGCRSCSATWAPRSRNWPAGSTW